MSATSREEAKLKQLIVTADDFGLSVPVNEAVESAHRTGILMAASLMVTAPAAADAIRRARRLPSLSLGLHLVLVDGRPALPAREIPDLVGPDGRFLKSPVRLGLRIQFERAARRQLAAEMRAQLEQYRATGLPLDHVDGHWHFHQHPVIVGLLIEMRREFGIRAIRVPYEPPLLSWRAQRDRGAARLASWLVSSVVLKSMRWRLQRAGIASSRYVFGHCDSGDMTAKRIDRFLAHLPDGVSEIYCHPASARWSGADNLPALYRCEEEFSALADSERRARLRASEIALTRYANLSPAPGTAA